MCVWERDDEGFIKMAKKNHKSSFVFMSVDGCVLMCCEVSD